MNLDTGAAVNTCALNFGSSGAGDGLFYRTASGELYYWWWTLAVSLCRSLNGRLAGVQKVLCSAEEILGEGSQDFYLRSEGGFVFLVQSNIGKDMRIHFRRLVSWYRRTQFIPVYIEDNILNLFLPEQRGEVNRNQSCENSQQPGDQYGTALRA